MEETLPKTIRFLVDDQGKKTDVIIPIADFDELLEDIFETAVARARLDDEDVPWEEAKLKLSEDG